MAIAGKEKGAIVWGLCGQQQAFFPKSNIIISG